MPYKTTEAQRANSRRVRAKRRAEGRCAYCGAIDERTQAGCYSCEACRIKKLAYDRFRRADRSDQHKEYAKMWRDTRRAEHRCTGCGKPLPEGDTHITCAECREKKMEWHRNKKLRCSLIQGLSAADRRQVCLNCPYPDCIEGED